MRRLRRILVPFRLCEKSDGASDFFGLCLDLRGLCSKDYAGKPGAYGKQMAQQVRKIRAQGRERRASHTKDPPQNKSECGDGKRHGVSAARNDSASVSAIDS